MDRGSRSASWLLRAVCFGLAISVLLRLSLSATLQEALATSASLSSVSTLTWLLTCADGLLIFVLLMTIYVPTSKP